MGKINFGRVLLGGLLAAVILNVGEWLLNAKLMAAEMSDFMTKHNFPQPGMNAIIMATVATVVLAIVMIWVYALIRPRLGPGIKTAIVAALIAWFGPYLYTTVFFVMFFGTPVKSAVLACVWGLVEYSLAAIAGAWVYKEA